MRLPQIAQHAADPDPAVAFYTDLLQVQPSANSIFRHEDDAIGPPGMDEWQAFITDSEGNTVGLIQYRPSE